MLCLHFAGKAELISFHSDQCVFVCACPQVATRGFHPVDGKNETKDYFTWRDSAWK